MKNLLAVYLCVYVFLFFSCTSEPDVLGLIRPDPTQMPVRQPIYVIDNYKGMDLGEEIPEWLLLYLENGVYGIESMEIYQFDYVFVSSNEGSNFNALNHWLTNFSIEQDFPRLAARRIENRFLLASPLPDTEFGSFFIELIRSVSDAEWTNAAMEDYFWIHKRVNIDSPPVYEFFILTAMSRTSFIFQYNILYDNVNPRMPITWEQTRALNRLRDNFFEDF